MGCYADAIVLRHPVKGSATIAAAVTSKPVLNAGDGVGEHPTQALIDLYTIYNELGSLDFSGKVVTMVGDLKNGRTVHSLSRLLALFNVTLNYVAPGKPINSTLKRYHLISFIESLKIPRYIYDELNAAGITQHETTDLDSVINQTDVLYVTRVQKERFESIEEYNALKDSFHITLATIANAKKDLVIMHPLPRVGEIAEEVDNDPRAAYFRQMENGMYIRMALLALVLGKA
jgi:aspartate carbamoyltransferase